jgi:hypothetical protein
MTYQSVQYSVPSLPRQTNIGAVYNFANITVDADGEATAVIFVAPITGSIQKVRFRTNTVTTGGDLDIRVEIVSAGEPTGTLWATNTNIVRTMLSTDDDTEFEVTLTASASVTAGDKVALVVTRPGGSSFAGVLSASTGNGSWGFPTGLSKTASYSVSGNMPHIRPVWTTIGQFQIFGISTYSDISTNTSLSTSTTPDIAGNVFSLPFDFKISHVWAFVDYDGEIELQVLDSDGVTVLASATNPATQPPTTSITLNVLPLSSELALSADTDYRIVVNPTTTTASQLRLLGFTDSASRTAELGFNNTYYTSAKDPADITDWTDDTTFVAWAGVLVSAIDIPAGGGGDPIGNGVVGMQSIGTGVITG